MNGWRFIESVALQFPAQSMCATQDGRIYVGADNNIVYRLQQDPTHSEDLKPAIFVQHTMNVPMKTPRFVACNDAMVAVSCATLNIVQVFDHAGNLLYTVGRSGEKGQGNGLLSRPQGVSVDKAGRLFVADWSNHRVLVVGAGGRILGRVNTGKRTRSVTVNEDRLFVGLEDGHIVIYKLKELQ